MSAIDVVGQYGAALPRETWGHWRPPSIRMPCGTSPAPTRHPANHVGPDAILAHLGRFMELSGGTFVLETDSATEAGDLVSATVRFRAQRAGHDDLDQHGVDVFRIAGDRIAEVWLISEDQEAEDRFWGQA